MPDPRILIMNKYTVAFPGYVGIENMKECDYAQKMLTENPGITPDDMHMSLRSLFDACKGARLEKEQYTKKNVANEKQFMRGASMCDVKDWRQKEPIYGHFYYKKYYIDPKMHNLHSIEVLNGPHKGANLLNYDFLSMNFPSWMEIREGDTHIFSDGEVIKSIDLFELANLLEHIGITNVFIIDPSCSLNMNSTIGTVYNPHANVGTANQAMTYSAINDLRLRYPSGTTHPIFPETMMTTFSVEPFTELPPKKCPKCDKDDCLIGSIGGIACCAGSCALGVPALVPSIVGAVGTAVANEYMKQPSSEEKMRRVGGLKKRMMKRTKRNKKKGKKEQHRTNKKTRRNHKRKF